MVVANKINYCTIMDLGFRSREQANEAFKGLKGTGFKTDKEYLEHYWDSYKNVIFKNKLEDLTNEAVQSRRFAFGDFLNDVIKERQELKAKTDIYTKYANLLDQYEMIQDYSDRITNEVCKLTVENESLKRCVEGMQHRIIDLQENNNNSSESSVNTNAINYIMNLKTKRTNQCYTCSICQEIIEKKETVYDTCHMFHMRCLTIYLLQDIRCPNCRDSL